MQIKDEVIELGKHDVLIVTGKHCNEYVLVVADKSQTTGVKIIKIDQAKVAEIIQKSISTKDCELTIKFVDKENQIYAFSAHESLASCITEVQQDGEYHLEIQVAKMKIKERDFEPDSKDKPKNYKCCELER